MDSSIMFSIVMPVYNVADFIDDSIGDIIAQTYGNYELILVDDASTDTSREHLNIYASEHDNIKLILQEQNRGVSIARNTGLAAAEGDYVLFLDPDDRYDSNLLARVAQYLRSESPEILVYSLREDYYKSNGRIDYSYTHSLPTGTYSGDEIPNVVLNLERETMLGYPWNKAYSVEYLRRIGASFEVVKHIEDILFNISVFEKVNKLTVISDVLYFYRNQGQARLTSLKLDDYFQLQTRRIEAFIELQKRWNNLSEDVLRVMANFYIRSLASHVEREIAGGIEYEDLRGNLREIFDSELYAYLTPHFYGSAKLKAAYRPFLEQNITKSILYANGISKVRRFCPSLFAKLKQNR